MSLGATFRAWAPLCLGLVAGASLGWLLAAWVTLGCLFALLVPLASQQATARAAAWHLGTFAAGLLIAGHLGFALGTPVDDRWVALLPLAALVLAQALTAAAAGGLAFRVGTRPATRLVLAVPALWLLHEWLQSFSPAAVPWIRIGYAQATGGPLIGMLSLGGVLMASALSFALAGLLALAWRARHSAAAARPLMAALPLVMAGLAAHEVPWTQANGSIAVDLLQTAVKSEDKQHADDATLQRWLGQYQEAIASSRADLVVTPQLALPKSFSAVPAAYWQRVSASLEQRGADALVGLYVEDIAGAGLYNAALAIGASGLQTHLKSNLFPFGEFVPFAPWLGAGVQALRSTPAQDLARPARPSEALYVGGHRVAVAICYEAAFGDAWRLRAAPADLLVNVSSDSAIDSVQLQRQTLAIVRARALELQKPLLRSSDVAGTVVIDDRGGVVAASPPGRAHVLHATVVTRSGLTPYGRFGDALPVALALCALGLALLRRTSGAHAPAVSATASLRRMGPRQRVSGQVLPAAVGLLLVVAGVFYLMVNSGQTVTEKIRVTNAADAAAYSAGAVEARALNYDAYMNRAIVANEIAIAQMVSLASWLDYFATAADNYGANITDTNFFVLPDPKVLVLDAALLGTNYISAYTGTTAQEYANYIIEYGLGPIITVHNAVAEALSLSQKAVQLNLAAGIRQRQIANDVAKAMDPALDAEVVLVSHGFDTFTKGYNKSGASDERGRLADVVTRSRDPFTRERNWTAEGFDIPFVRKDGALKKRGGTELIGYDEWRAVDTLELHGRTFGCGKFGLSWCDDIRRPIGWGAVEVDAGGGDAGRGYHGNAYGENPTTASRAESYMRNPTYAYFTGIPDSRELRDLDPKADITTGITIRVSKAHASMLTSGGAATAKPSGDLALFNDRPAGGQLAALSRAQVFFDRISPRADGKDELGSLYNPYWRVRLVAPTAADKAYAASKQGGMVLP